MMARRLLILPLLALLAACSSSETIPSGSVVVQNATPAAAQVSLQDYHIAPYDVLDITVFQVKDLDRTVQVTSTGTIVLPLIGEIRAAGRTTKEVEAEVTAKLGASYLQNPRVSVAIKQAAGQSITVDGAVMKPGVFPLTGTVSLVQSVALAGGLNEVATKGSVTISRLEGDKREIRSYDLEQIQSGKIGDPVLHAGDIVIVGESGVKTTLRDTSRTIAPIATGLGAVKPW